MLNGSELPTPFLITSVWRNFLVGCYSEAYSGVICVHCVSICPLPQPKTRVSIR
jgi:hypothetical protein